MAERKNLQSPVHKDAITIIKRLFSGGEILPEQVPRAAHWSCEKELAAAVFMDGLIEVRDFHCHALDKRRVKEDLEWIFTDDPQWPLSFARLCEVFTLDPTRVRKIVSSWLTGSAAYMPRKHRRYRDAA